VARDVVPRRGLGRPREDEVPGLGRCAEEQDVLPGLLEELAAAQLHGYSLTGSGLWGLWHVTQSASPAWSFGSICGKPFGFATFFEMAHEAQRLGLELGRDHRRRVGDMLVRRAVAGLASHAGVLSGLLQDVDLFVAVETRVTPGEDQGADTRIGEGAGP
jgi:hypothetical protein